MTKKEIKQRLEKLYQEKFEYLESALAYAVPEESTDAEAFDMTIRLTGELNGIVESADAIGIELGRIRVNDSWTVGYIRERVLRERAIREATRQRIAAEERERLARQS